MSRGPTPASLQTLVTSVVDRLAHDLGHLRIAARIHHHIADAAHQILAEADLGIHQAGGGDDIAAGEIAEMAGDGGRADIDRKPIDLVVEARPDRGDLLAVMDGDRDLPLALAQRLLQALDHAQVGIEILQVPLLAQRLFHALQIAGGIVHVRLGDLDVMQAHHGIELDRPHLGPLAHHLLVDLAFRRHVDDGIAIEQGRTGETASGRQAALLGIALFDGPEVRRDARPSR